MSLLVGPAGAIPPRGKPGRPHRRWWESYLEAHPLIHLACSFLALVGFFGGCMISLVFGLGLVFAPGQTMFGETGFEEGPIAFALFAAYFVLILGTTRLSWKSMLALNRISAGLDEPIKAMPVPPSGLWDRDLDEPY